MTIADILNSYEEVKNDLKFQSMSSVRIKIMISLSEGSKKTENLTELTGMQTSGILYCIKELEKERLISKDGNNYYLTKIGQKITSNLVDIIKTIIVVKKTRNLWLNHEIDAIPQELLMKIGDLSKSELIESENTDLAKTHETHIQVVLNSKEIKGVSPIFYSDYIETFNTVLEKGVNVELILTEDILKKTIESLDGMEDLNKLISAENLTVWKLDNNIKVAFTVTDKIMTLGLFSNEGIHDSTRLLISEDEDALQWGNKLFDYYLKKAQKVNLEDLKEICFN